MFLFFILEEGEDAHAHHCRPSELETLASVKTKKTSNDLHSMERHKIPLTQDKIVHVKTSEGFVTDFIELMTEFGKTGRYKFYIKVSAAFLCVNKGHVGAKVGAWFY